MHLSPKQPVNTFPDDLALTAYSLGMGALGLPGDLSSASRFVRVAFTKMNAFSGDSEKESVSQFFHILGSVDQQRGCCEVADGKYEITHIIPLTISFLFLYTHPPIRLPPLPVPVPKL